MAWFSTSFGVLNAFMQPAHSQRKGFVVSILIAGWLGGGDGEGVGEHGGGVPLVEGVLRPFVTLATRTAVVGGAESADDASEMEGEVVGLDDDRGVGTSSPVPSSWGRASAPSIWVTCCSPVGTAAMGAATLTTDC